jgi:hypothetical protein
LALYGVQAEPSLSITKPSDGDWFVDPDVSVRGRANVDTIELKVDSDDFENGTFNGVTLVDGRLVFQPINQFEDWFNIWDVNKWEIVNTGTIMVRDGTIILRRADNITHPLLVSKGDVFPEGMDWSTRVIMSFSDTGNFTEGYGWGITTNDTHVDESIVSIYSDRSVGNYHSLFVNGQWVSNWGYNDGQMGLLEVMYTDHNDTYMVKLYGRIVSTFSGVDKPVRFWMGCPIYQQLDEWQWMDVIVDQIDIWTYTGSWTSDVYDMGGSIEFTDVSRSFTTSHSRDSRVFLEARASDDNVNWSDWMKLDQADDGAESRYFQFRVIMSMKDIRSDVAYIRMPNFRLEYQHPLQVVQVRVNGGEWMNATGTDRWDHMVTMAEDDNYLEVRVFDTGGYSNDTGMSLTLDTTVPVGTVDMDVEGTYTNDRNITFTFNATDKYGIKGIRIALSEDFRDEEVVEPYVDTMVWTLPGGFVKTDVYIRYVDNHGLFSESFQFFFFYDPLPPTGALHIQGGAPHTDEMTVSIDLEYQDNWEVASVELSHDDTFRTSIQVSPGVHLYEGWELQPGGSGVRRVYMRVRDLAGSQVVVFDDIDLYVATAMGEVRATGGNLSSERLVQVAVFAPTEIEAFWMQVSEDSSFNGVPWVDVGHYSTIVLAEGDGEKRIFVRFKDIRGYVTLPVFETIVLDTTPPQVTIELNNGVYLTQVPSSPVLIQFRDASPPGNMWISERNDLSEATPTPISAFYHWNFTNVEGVHTLNVWVSDIIGNVGHATGSVYYATQGPQCVPVLVDGRHTNAVDVLRVEVQVIDIYDQPVEVQLGFDEDPPVDAEWIASGGIMLVPIPNGTDDGSYVVTVRGRNALGLVGQVASSEVILDRTLPACTIVGPLNGTRLELADTLVDLRLELHDDSGIVRVAYKVDDNEWTILDPNSKGGKVDIGHFGEHNISVEVVDAAGNRYTFLRLHGWLHNGYSGGGSHRHRPLEAKD